MKTAYLGIDVGSISTKAVLIDKKNKILARDYLWTEVDPIGTVKKLLYSLSDQLAKINEHHQDNPYQVQAVGTTGSARRLIGSITGASVIKNEITTHAIGTTSLYPEVRTIFEIGGQDSKIILIENGIVVDYAMNTLCAAGTGAFLSSLAQRLNEKVEDIGEIALTSDNPTRLAARCSVFAESDMVHKSQIGHSKKDIIAGICQSVVTNYMNNVAKGKRIIPPIIFQGGVSKNIGVTKAFERTTGHEIHVDPDSHLIGALGTAILAKNSKNPRPFDFRISEADFQTKGINCDKCANHCEVIAVYQDEKLIDAWGNKCDRGRVI